ncbi:MAG TPA: archease [Nitrospiria bacterium]|nr:archease [Nitrospiria bacterium]
MTTLPRWEHFPHGADIGVRGVGRSKAEAFEQAALALTAVITDPDALATKEPIAISCDASDDELGLVDWLNAIVYEMATRRMVFGRFKVDFEGGRLQATAWGEPLDPARHQPAVEVKGATYTELRVRENTPGEWSAQCVVDV